LAPARCVRASSRRTAPIAEGRAACRAARAQASE
jgi:hypothetical protein